uniref:uncharacterized protein LOC109955949 n=1 Tax=Monopterus albus TaxID=43700 RepID=UPI0009B4B7AA|nr:uncharacterized protein LOC109955949 [Monopterus albus]
MPLQAPEGMSGRKRRPNWTDQESLLLAQLMQEKKDIIRGKCSTGVSVQDKRQAWEEIVQAINTAFPQIQRTVSDCNKKWENLLAKAKEEIKRQKRQACKGEGLSLEHFSNVTQIVISVMNLSDMLQRDRNDSSVSEVVENSCDNDGNNETVDEIFTNEHPLTDYELSMPHNPPTSPAEQKMSAFPNVATSVPVQLRVPRAAAFMVSGEHLDTPCSTSCSAQSTTLQERLDLEMSVLRRQQSVLKLQEEYYTLKIKLMKKQMEKPP